MFDRDEMRAEIAALDALSTGLSDGMIILKAMNLSRPVSNFEPVPARFMDVDDYVDRFIAYRLDTMKTPEQRALWGMAEARHDTALYVRRKVWEGKAERGDIIGDIPRVLAVTMAVQKPIRGRMHEAINHAAKHNKDVEALGRELHESMDALVKGLLEENARLIAGAARVAIPDLQVNLLEGSN